MKPRTKGAIAVLAVALLAAVSGLIPAAASHNGDIHSDNIKMLTQQPIMMTEEAAAQGSDLAFEGKLVIAGGYEGPSIFKIVSAKQGYIKQLAFLPCTGSQGDVSVYGDLLFVSVDSPRAGPSCDVKESAAASQQQIAQGTAFEGVRVVSIKDPTRPEQVAAVDTPCGSHTHTLLPKGKSIFIYIESYPLVPTSWGTDCNPIGHRKISIVEVPLSDPGKAEIVGDLGVAALGCHDVTTFPSKNLAVAACINYSIVLDVKDPAAPEVLAEIVNPDIQIHHSTAMTWDGKYLLLGDEAGGAQPPASQGCNLGQNGTAGALWVYDITDPANPVEAGHYGPPRRPPLPDTQAEANYLRCTTHNFNVLPMKDPKRYIAVVSYYNGGISVVDFSDPSAPEEIGYYLPLESGTLPDMWASYWYNGLIYTNDHASKLGVGVFELEGTGKKDVRYFRTRMNPQLQIPEFK
ncbi:MAG: LVIVD repeat-containing protein [Actinomycetota bacterium]